MSKKAKSSSNEPMTFDARGNGDGKTALTLTGDHQRRVSDHTSVICEPVVYRGESITSDINKSNPKSGDPCHTLSTDPRNYLTETRGGNDMGQPNATVRRLTPLECERLQGFPDGWTDIGDWIDTEGKKHKLSDAPRYKALGNSIATPFGNGLRGGLSGTCKPKEQNIRQWRVSSMA